MTTDFDLFCNRPKCRKRLQNYAWVTSCSHIFCDKDGAKEFNSNLTCPACKTELSQKFDVVRIDLNPSEQYKSMILAGQKPEVVMEACSRALSFWTYQACQEKVYHEYLAKSAKDKLDQMEQYCEQVASKCQAEISTLTENMKSLKTQLATQQKEIEEEKKRGHDIAEKLNEKSRQYSKLQSMYDKLRRKGMTPIIPTEEPPRKNHPRQNNFDLVIGEGMLRPRPGYGDGQGPQMQHTSMHRPREKVVSPPERDFHLKPVLTPKASDYTDAERQFQMNFDALMMNMNPDNGRRNMRNNHQM